jgi:serine/threonine protein kinase
VSGETPVQPAKPAQQSPGRANPRAAQGTPEGRPGAAPDGRPAIPVMRPGGPLTGLAPGARVAGYVLQQLIGVGGMAAVYQARDERLGRVVALKLLAGDEAVRLRFVREARAVAAVDHPHIIPVYAAGEADGMQYIAMRFVAGGTLQAVIAASGPMPPRRVAAFISPVASALDAAHAASLVHRDVKPGNVLVDVHSGGPEHAYLTDFGIARAMLSAGTLTAAGQFLGTPDYAAPEQVNGQPVDGRADQYALACVAFEMLSGAVPFKRELPIAVLYAHLSTPPPRLSALRPGLSAAVDGVLARGMAKDPDERYRACADFADALRTALGLGSYDLSHTLPDPPIPRTLLDRPAPVGTWSAVVTVDRDYFNSVRALNDSDTAAISFPGTVPERRIPLSGAEVLIGRYSASRGIEPQIDLGVPPMDPSVSRRHAKLIPAPDGAWTIVDLGATNGITVNGRDVPSEGSVSLRPGDRIHLGAWTKITLTRD